MVIGILVFCEAAHMGLKAKRCFSQLELIYFQQGVPLATSILHRNINAIPFSPQRENCDFLTYPQYWHTLNMTILC